MRERCPLRAKSGHRSCCHRAPLWGFALEPVAKPSIYSFVRKLLLRQVPTKRGTMLKSIPWDVWIAAGLAVVVVLAAFFDAGPAIFIFIFLGLCVYVAVQTFGSKRDR